jgi:choline dehydrogenase-like flavoprotein
MLFMTVKSETTALLGAIPCFPLSRGNVHITSPDVNDMPAIDPRFFDNEFDLEILARHVQILQIFTDMEALEPFLQKITLEPSISRIKDMLRQESALTTHHVCGTAAMLPREVGGVVDQELKVYGTKNLRVVDASIFPLIPHANPIATVYAVAERAADITRGK